MKNRKSIQYIYLDYVYISDKYILHTLSYQLDTFLNGIESTSKHFIFNDVYNLLNAHYHQQNILFGHIQSCLRHFILAFTMQTYICPLHVFTFIYISTLNNHFSKLLRKDILLMCHLIIKCK